MPAFRLAKIPGDPPLRRRTRRLWPVGLSALALSAVPAVADILHLANGGVVEGEILSRDEQGFKVRTPLGTVALPAGAVQRIEAAPSPFQEYDKRAAETADTPAAQLALAQWCEQAGLNAERLKHFQRAVELDPDNETARKALGQVRVGGLWVDARTVVDRSPPKKAAAEPDGERLAAAIQAQWLRRIRAIRDNLLESPVPSHNAEGRNKLLAIEDPLAIAPLADELSRSSVPGRLLLVECLSRFKEDEATLNLGVMALLDPDAGVRRRTLTQLIRRDDPRIAAQFRQALASGNDVLVRRAAEGLGLLRAKPAVPDLIELLTVQRRKQVVVPVQRYLGDWAGAYANGGGVRVGGALVAYQPRVGVAVAGNFLNVDNELQWQDVTVFRTEVLEALKQITGENFGFDGAAWRRWYEEKP